VTPTNLHGHYLDQENMAEVKILLKGYFKWIEKNKCKASSTITLIRDENKNILFDTGNIGEEEKLIKALKKENLTPEDIDIVINSHSHPDHIGCNHLFKRALFINSESTFRGDEFTLRKGSYEVTKNVKLIPTPGHTDECCSALVKTQKGLIVVVGDLFWSSQDSRLAFVKNEKLLKKSRAKIIKVADYIVPGHAGMFEVIKG